MRRVRRILSLSSASPRPSRSRVSRTSGDTFGSVEKNHLCSQSGRGLRVVLPVWRDDAARFVVAREAVDAALDEDEAVLTVDVVR